MGKEGRIIKPPVYLLAGSGLFLVKFVIDRLVARAFGRDWSFMNYLIPSETYSLYSLPPQERSFYLVMLLVALPFVVVGLLLTWWRLRDAGLPRWLVVLFFIPAVNLVFFTLLGFWPSRRVETGGSRAGRAITARGPVVARSIPTAASFCIAAVAGAIASSLCIVLGVLLLGNYGWGAFVAAPFVCGMSAAWIHGLAQPRGEGAGLAVAAVALTLAGGALILSALEGAVCLIMAAPLAYPIALVGGLLGHALAMERHRRAGLGRGFEVLPALCVPLLITLGEAAAPAHPPLHRVTTVIIVDAPADRVWQHVISFPDLPRPRHWLFSTGIAYPVRARIDGTGPGAIRYCEFSTGAFVEPITLWQPPDAQGAAGVLRFDVTECPPPLIEWSWTSIHPPHLEDFLMSRQGQFKVIPLPDGLTRLEGTTWYEHAIWPDAYWRLWSNWIIGHIHVEVLEHVKHLAEQR